MSFILDALKKAEAEKNAGKPPEAIAVLTAPVPVGAASAAAMSAVQRRDARLDGESDGDGTATGRGTRERWLLGGVLLLSVALVVAVVLLVLRPRSNALKPSASESSAASGAALPGTAGESSPDAVDVATAVAPDGTSPGDVPADPGPDGGDGTQAAIVPSPVPDGDTVFLDAPEPTATAEEAGADAATLDDLVGEDESETAGDESADATDDPAEVATDDAPAGRRAGSEADIQAEPDSAAIAALSRPARPVRPPRAAVPAPPGVKRLRDMPPAFRTQFPQLNIDVHNFDEENPLRRFVIINGRKYRETDTLVEGPKVVEITQGGLILDQNGTRVVKSIPR